MCCNSLCWRHIPIGARILRLQKLEFTNAIRTFVSKSLATAHRTGFRLFMGLKRSVNLSIAKRAILGIAAISYCGIVAAAQIEYFSAKIAPIGHQLGTVASNLNFQVALKNSVNPAAWRLTISDSVPALPEGANFIDNGSGTGTFNWSPVEGDENEYSVTFAAIEKGAAGKVAEQTMTVTVAALASLVIDPIGNQSVTLAPAMPLVS